MKQEVPSAKAREAIRLLLHYYNDTLRQQEVISQEDYHRIRQLIDAREALHGWERLKS